MRLIDADALIADCNVYNSWDAQIVKAWVDDQPTVDAVPVRHGHWNKMNDVVDDEECNGYKCSNCGEWMDYKSHFCPNCGVRMDVE